ncbi:histidine phosphatase superfamily [Fimicolochytrium jonesii]|uniref:histidine phosphatase superfamily n=1 Tax=Fimicolochytrium jonesii TaxID=1396493 RepID=UPI0022FEF4DC|nr:histidine phosphatase superfamily [Fimicolochytrium jonesii]KAI8824153.1 histidine phosphatase superfamily [Fimicolochytrium jonesii]
MSPYFRTAAPHVAATKLACVMVGLPARGKTYVARKIARYLAWLGHHSRIFNVGNYRRVAVGAVQPHDFFDPTNPAYAEKRKEVADKALEDMLSWFGKAGDAPATGAVLTKDGPMTPVTSRPRSDSLSVVGAGTGGPGWVAVYDATNSTAERRQGIYEECLRNGVDIMFIESICDNDDIILANIKEVKLSSPDYVGMDPEKAVEDFSRRIQHYQMGYQTLDPSECSGNIPFVKVINVGDQVIVNKVKGYLQSRIVYFLMNLNITPKSFFFTRHGESMYNVQGKIGGDADLSPQGMRFAQRLPGLLADKLPKETKLTVWTSTLKRTMQTASHLEFPQLQWKQLDELDSGVCDELTYEEIAERYPNDFSERDLDKFNYRYHGGESYRDLVQRLEPVIMELERHHERDHAILIVGHQAVLRAIYAYFLNYSLDELPYVKIPLHTVVKLTPKAYGCAEERYEIDIPAVDTHRGMPHPALDAKSK